MPYRRALAGPRRTSLLLFSLLGSTACTGELATADSSAATLDAYALDAPGLDAPGFDASRPDAAGLDAPGLDAALPVYDAAPLPDAGPVECTSPADCPAPAPCQAPARCEASRCTYADLGEGASCGSDLCAPGRCDAAGACVVAPVVCNDPPESTDLAGCTPGSTIHVPLGGPCGGHCVPATGDCTYDSVILTCPAAGTVLPQRSGYQVVLRESMAALTAADFDVTPAPITYTPGLSDDELFRLWSGMIRAGSRPGVGGDIPALPDYAGVNVPSASYTLASIERGSGLPHAYVGDSSATSWTSAFYATWDYAGNPYFGDAALMRRAFYAAAADLMTMEDCTARRACTAGASGAPVVNDNFAGAFREYAHIAYYAHRSGLIDTCDLAAYDVGLRRLFDHWEGVRYSSPNADMIMATLPGVHYAAEAIGDPELRTRAAAKVADLLARNCDEAGFCYHQNGTYDASYEGYSAVHIAEAAVLTRHPDLVLWNDRFAALRGFTTLPEPDGRLVGPSHFSPATSMPAARDQASGYTRETAVAQLSDEGLFFLHAGKQPFPTLDTMTTFLGTATRVTEANSWARDMDNATMRDWSYRHYPYQNAPGFQFFASGSFARFSAAAGTDLALPPMRRSADFSRTFGDELVSARRGSIGAIVHFGAIDRGAPGSGFGGGAVSAIWTAETGAVLLGWNRGSQHPSPFGWGDLLGWPTHAISGTRGSTSFSTARVVDPTQTITVAGDTTSIETTADANGTSSESGAAALAGAFEVRRTFELAPGADARGRLTITTRITSSGNSADEVLEVLPIFLGEVGSTAATTIRFRRVGGAVLDASTAGTDDVEAILVTRFGRTIEIALDTPRAARLSPTETTSTYQWQPRSRNVLVRLHAGGAIPSALTLTETVRLLP